ncbi:MAG: prepilin-type N-terminal cleavage/methylation domain-containing protein [Kosmotoga sp.]|uniref:prepilin-type N-terminal cleavage/methylation domain-containing protein n=1 Tax=Kosmotoga sp. TaxID=1955248 RepID=UPI0025BE673B|nr:prepilin-type N-terminal cleavage/methylation domain-containing protein [Kosmotoga sp.]MCD6160154.1 prepilin-type N-terminal cleavage/methylation domain-containing protein [Kosmotoga sp.]
MNIRKTGLSLIEMLITLLVISAILVVVFQVFVSVNSNLHDAYSNMRDFNDIRRGISALWALDNTGTPTDFTNLTRYQKLDEFFQELKNEGISDEVIDYLSENLEFWQLTPDKSQKIYLAVRPLASWR